MGEATKGQTTDAIAPAYLEILASGGGEKEEARAWAGNEVDDGRGARCTLETADSDDAWPVGITRAALESACELSSLQERPAAVARMLLVVIGACFILEMEAKKVVETYGVELVKIVCIWSIRIILDQTDDGS